MVKTLLKQLARSSGYEIRRVPSSVEDANVARLDWLSRLRDEDGVRNLPNLFVASCARHFSGSKAQLFQDVFALTFNDFKREGFFVEFGATDGVNLSNTYLLETQYGWRGILAEPARSWHTALSGNRRAHISTRCVWKTSDETLAFREASAGELSTLQDFAKSDGHAKQREDGQTYTVETISLTDLLQTYSAPRLIDYLSIDTEGSEYEILRAHDFSRFRFSVISVEHNYTPSRELIHGLLVKHGYHRVLEQFSKWDDWYVDSSLASLT